MEGKVLQAMQPLAEDWKLQLLIFRITVMVNYFVYTVFFFFFNIHYEGRGLVYSKIQPFVTFDYKCCRIGEQAFISF